jgi:hypothetical protein
MMSLMKRIVIAGVASVGLLGVLAACYCYPLVDMYSNESVPLLLVVFVPLGLACLVIKREEFVKVAGPAIAIVACISAAFLFLNGLLDTHAPALIETRVIAKSVGYGKGGGFVLTVAPSWRDGRKEETLGVSSSTYYMILEGQSVQVVVHRGAFGLPWFSSVLPG